MIKYRLFYCLIFVLLSITGVPGQAVDSCEYSGFGAWRVEKLNIVGNSSSSIYQKVMSVENMSWVVGEDNEILVSTDYEKTWKVTHTASGSKLIGGFFASRATGWVVGSSKVGKEGSDKYQGAVYKTVNGGKTWDKGRVLSGFERSALHDIFFLDEHTGWAVGEADTSDGDAIGVIVATSDGGRTWLPQPITGTVGSFFHSITFKDRSTGFVAGEHAIVKTVDGGLHWRTIVSDKHSYFSIEVLPDDRVIAAGYGGQILGGTDNVLAPMLNATSDIFFVRTAFLNDKEGWVVGSEPNGKLKILSTCNGGQTWRTDSSVNVDLTPYSISVSSNRILIVGSGRSVLVRDFTTNDRSD